MRTWPPRVRKSPRIEIIPMIDVMMFLLVFFVLISLNALPSLGLKVVLPFASNAAHLELPKRVTVTLSADGTLYLDGAQTTLADLPAQLEALAHDNRIAVIIAGDRDSRLQGLVSILDVLKAAGIGSASIVARTQ
jgi:biopolymer transport protein ExbD